MSVILIKKLTTTDTNYCIIMWFTITSTILSLPLSIINWIWPTTQDFILLVIIGILGSLGHSFAIFGLRLSDATYLLPIDFSRLLWTSILGFFIFNEIPEIWTIIGALFILFSTCILIIYNQK